MHISPAIWKHKSPTLKKVREILRANRYSPSTEEAYISCCADFFAWSNCGSADCLDGNCVERYLTHLAVEKKVAASTQNQAFNAILFLFRRVLEKEFGKINTERAKVSQNIPEWLTRNEIGALFSQLNGDWLLLAKLAYGTGLRLMELLRLRIKDIDFGNGFVVVRDGKGGKDRMVTLPKVLESDLRARVELTRAIHKSDLANGFGKVWLPGQLAKKYPGAPTDFKWQYLFPSHEICKGEDGMKRRHHLFPNGFQHELKKAGLRAKISKRLHPHVLRHSFATHFLENGGNLQMLQNLMGHKDVKTTMIYTHCVDLKHARSPMDLL